MASVPTTMMSPICLVGNKNKQLLGNQQAIQILDKISQPVVLVTIVGQYCTRKSYLMNCLAGKESNGFRLGSTVQSETKDIWMWCLPHPSKPNHTLVLLDTEGLGDVEKSDPKNDSWIFALAVLLSSTFVYNSVSTNNNNALDQLHYVAELTELIKAKSSPNPSREEDSTEFANFFPDFIWAVRDFTLELKLDDQPITEDEYLENALKLIPGENPNVKNSNQSRECIKQFFPKRKCFVFDRPKYEKELLAHLEYVLENQLDPKFQEQSNNFCSYIFTHARTKTLSGGVKFTGNRLGTLVVTYVDAIKSGAVPCLESAVVTLVQFENSAAVQKAAEHYYKEQMVQRVTFPTDTLQELLDVHTGCEREAIAVFMRHSFKDDNREFQKTLMEIIKKKKEEFMLQNEKASIDYCQAILDRLLEPLMEKISAGTFCVPGGYNLYIEPKKRILHQYWQVSRKGGKANEVLQNFLQSQAAIENSILQSDKGLTLAEKAVAAERAQKKAAEKEQELLRQKLKEQRQQMAAQRSLEENIAQLRYKLEMEKDIYLREMERLLDHTLTMQNEMPTERLRKKIESMNVKIIHLRMEIEVAQNDETPQVSRTLDSCATEATSILSASATLVGLFK
ncbi:LOW QUALITY PROTEIN: guanylate-binding protein 6-like [Tamandua tetradactyla]|uniref:LOW QUALITY PROTEIN: guanylate-binding protein 6-like n=1 Tax=Tamandua tetradactyla TaxID=48850 RepID=UPI0040547195